jgi:hypothetical protein
MAGGTPRWPGVDYPDVGVVYTVAAAWTNKHGKELLQLVELRIPKKHRKNGFNAERFRPVVERKTDISIFTAMLKTQKKSKPCVRRAMTVISFEDEWEKRTYAAIRNRLRPFYGSDVDKFDYGALDDLEYLLDKFTELHEPPRDVVLSFLAFVRADCEETCRMMEKILQDEKERSRP